MRKVLSLFIAALICSWFLKSCATVIPIEPNAKPVIEKNKSVLKAYKKNPDSVSKENIIDQLEKSNFALIEENVYSKALKQALAEEKKEFATYKEDNAWKISLGNWIQGIGITLIIAAVIGVIIGIAMKLGVKIPFLS